MSCLPIVSDSCDRREQVFRVGAAAPRVFNSKYLFLKGGISCDLLDKFVHFSL